MLVTGINFSSAYSHIHRVIPGRLWRNKMDIMHAELLSIAENIVFHSQAAFNWVMDPKNRTIVKTILWIGAVSLLLTLTVTFILMPYFFTASYKFGIAATVLWAILFGIFILFILPYRLVTTVFSGFLGIGASQWSTADGLITKADKSITKIVYQVTSIVGGQTHGMEDFIKSMTLVFFVILIVLCLPAFNRD